MYRSDFLGVDRDIENCGIRKREELLNFVWLLVVKTCNKCQTVLWRCLFAKRTSDTPQCQPNEELKRKWNFRCFFSCCILVLNLFTCFQKHLTRFEETIVFLVVRRIIITRWYNSCKFQIKKSIWKK